MDETYIRVKGEWWYLYERDRFELSYATRLNRGVGLYFGLRA